MISSNKNNRKRLFKKIILFVLIFFGFIYWLYILVMPVKIISFVREGSRIYLFVEHFPVTNKGRIAWWLDNKELLIEKYDVPFIGSKYPWSVLIGEAGDGFQFLQHRASDNDLICFDSLKPGAHCAEKKWLLRISHFNQVNTRYTTDDSEYIRGENAEIRRVDD